MNVAGMTETTHHGMDADLRESEGPFYLMSEHAPVMIWMSDASGRCLHLNKLLRDFWGVTNDGLENFDWTATMHPDDSSEIGRLMTVAMAKRESVSIKGRYRRADGSFRILQTEARPRLEKGEFLGMIGVNIDITERETAEQARRKAESDRDLLVAELKHRVKNTLSVVQAIARQTFRAAAEDARMAFDGRILALAQSHDLLTRSKWEEVSFQELAETALQLRDAVDVRVSLSGPVVLLQPRHALAIGMVLHELFTNALKYGALSENEGRIALEWATLTDESPPQLKILWRESGGPTVSVPSRKGFGSQLLERTLKGELDGDVMLDFLPSGLVCSINVCLPKTPDCHTAA
jgi:PAS domain S-box-containing protein